MKIEFTMVHYDLDDDRLHKTKHEIFTDSDRPSPSDVVKVMETLGPNQTFITLEAVYQ